jgi:uncharacterized membrane protein
MYANRKSGKQEVKKMAKGSTSTKSTNIMLELFLIGILGPIALQAIAAGNYTGVDPTIVTIFTILIPVLAGIAMALKWLGKI